MSSRLRRRAYKSNHIDALQVFEECDWICHICGEAINKEYRLPNTQAATIDHIVPLSRGGLHIKENVRPAHAQCNYDKADRLLEECDGTIRSHIS